MRPQDGLDLLGGGVGVDEGGPRREKVVEDERALVHLGQESGAHGPRADAADHQKQDSPGRRRAMGVATWARGPRA